MNELRSKASAFLTRPCIISEPGRSLVELIRRYAAGERLDDLESQRQLSLCLGTAQEEVDRLHRATTYPELDALAFYQRAAAILQDIQAESSTGRA